MYCTSFDPWQSCVYIRGFIERNKLQTWFETHSGWHWYFRVKWRISTDISGWFTKERMKKKGRREENFVWNFFRQKLAKNPANRRTAHKYSELTFIYRDGDAINSWDRWTEGHLSLRELDPLRRRWKEIKNDRLTQWSVVWLDDSGAERHFSLNESAGLLITRPSDALERR